MKRQKYNDITSCVNNMQIFIAMASDYIERLDSGLAGDDEGLINCPEWKLSTIQATLEREAKRLFDMLHSADVD